MSPESDACSDDEPLHIRQREEHFASSSCATGLRVHDSAMDRHPGETFLCLILLLPEIESRPTGTLHLVKPL